MTSHRAVTLPRHCPQRREVRITRLRFVLGLIAASGLHGEEVPAKQVTESAVQVVARQEITLGKDTVGYVRIRPPVLPLRPASAAATDVDSANAEPIEASLPPAPEKAYLSVAIEAEVFITGPAPTNSVITRLMWREGGQVYQAWSNADFRLLTQIAFEETATHRVMWFPFVTESPAPTTPRPAAFDALAALPAGAPIEYLLEGDATRAAQTAPVLDFLDLLHARYALDHESLRTDLLVRQAQEIERRRAAEAEAARPQRQTLYYWKMSAEEAAR